MKVQITFLLALILLTTSFVSAYPGIPHQFYGSVTVNGQPALDNNIVVAAVEGEYYMTATKDGKYGYSPNIFYVEDPDGDRVGKTISFYLGGRIINGVYDFRGVPVDTEIFTNNGFTKLDISTTTTCGDGYCIGDETCSNCQSDCGICTNPPIITIKSPLQGSVYDTLKINLEVSADQNILIWWYSLNGKEFVQFSPNIILTTKEGENTLTIKGINQFIQPGESSTFFTVDLPEAYCGDAICNNGETCSSCSVDCGACPAPPSSGGGGGGGSGGGGGGGGSITTKASATNQSSTNTTSQNQEETGQGTLETETQNENNKGFFGNIGAGITGAVVGVGENPLPVAAGFVVLIAVVFMSISLSKKKKKKINSETSFFHRK